MEKISDLSPEEATARKKLIEVCKYITEDFSE